MSKPLTREELAQVARDVDEEHDLETLHDTIGKLLNSHRSLWTAADAITAGWQRDQDLLRQYRKRDGRQGW